VIAPIIGMCAAYETASWQHAMPQEAAFVPGGYVRKVQAAGGLAVLLVPDLAAEKEPDILLDRIDGLLLVGGVDVQPETYGHSASAHLEVTSPLRDDFELALTRAAFARDMPVVGICRGLQVMNVANGGTLHQHLTDCGYAEHRPYPKSLGANTYHTVEIRAATLAARAAGAGIHQVNSHHHQGIDRVAEGAVVAARAATDGLVEALEWPALRFAMGVQWHPEEMPVDHIIAALVGASAASPATNDKP